MKRKPTDKVYPVTQALRSRIKNKQNQEGILDREMAVAADVSVNTYKNIKNGLNKTVEHHTLRLIATKLGTNINYLLYGEDEDIIVPIRLLDDKMILDICDALKKMDDATTLRNLHFVLCKLPPEHRNKYIGAFNQLLEYIKNYSFIEFTSSKMYDDNKISAMHFLIDYEKTSSKKDALETYLTGVQHLKDGESNKALPYFFQVVQCYLEKGQVYKVISDSAIDFIIPIVGKLKKDNEDAGFRKLKRCGRLLKEIQVVNLFEADLTHYRKKVDELLQYTKEL